MTAEQTSFVEPIKLAKRRKTAPAKLAIKFGVLADWYQTHKPQVKSLRITSDDAWSLREYWKANEIECRSNGFIVDTLNIQWRGFDLVEV